MPRSAPSSFRAAIQRGFGGQSLVGRLRMVAFTMLGLTAAAALSIVAFVANQGWPDVGALVPGLPIERQAVSESSIVAKPTPRDNPLVIAAIPAGSTVTANDGGAPPVHGAQIDAGGTGGSGAAPSPATAVAAAPSPQTRTPAAAPAAASQPSPESAPAPTTVSSPAVSSPEAPASSAPATPAPTTDPSTPSGPGKGTEPPGKVVEAPGEGEEGAEEDEGAEEEAAGEEPGNGEEAEEAEESPDHGWGHGGPSGPPWSDGGSGHGGWPGHGYGRSR